MARSRTLLIGMPSFLLFSLFCFSYFQPYANQSILIQLSNINSKTNLHSEATTGTPLLPLTAPTFPTIQMEDTTESPSSARRHITDRARMHYARHPLHFERLLGTSDPEVIEYLYIFQELPPEAFTWPGYEELRAAVKRNGAGPIGRSHKLTRLLNVNH